MWKLVRNFREENTLKEGTSYLPTRVLSQLVVIRRYDEAQRSQSAGCHGISNLLQERHKYGQEFPHISGLLTLTLIAAPGEGKHKF